MVNHVVSMLSKMFSLAQTWELVPHGCNACKAVRHYREEPRERFLTPEEYRRVGAALREVAADGSIARGPATSPATGARAGLRSRPAHKLDAAAQVRIPLTRSC